MNRSIPRRLSLFCLLAALTAPLVAGPPDVQILIQRAGISKGICSVPNCGGAEVAVEIARAGSFLVHAFDDDPGNVEEAVRRTRRAKLYAGRVQVERLASDPMPYVDNFVDLVVIDNSSGIRSAEVGRVVRPRGCVLVRSNPQMTASLRQAGFEINDAANGWTLARKPPLEGADDWPHWYHGPDNNPLSGDTAIRAPYLTQWFARPYYHAMPVVSTAAAGRIFIASGHIAHHDREIPTLNTLIARNGYNGRILWQRSLPQGYLVHRSAFIATEDVFYMIQGDGILRLDPETGSELGRFRIPETPGAIMWMAKLDEVLYVLTGENDPPAEIMKVHADFRGWGWNNVDKSYSRSPIEVVPNSSTLISLNVQLRQNRSRPVCMSSYSHILMVLSSSL